MANGTDNFAEDQRRAEVFDALSHPTRILILKALSQEPLGFADLKKKTGIESSGHLQHHLNKLSGLVKTDEYGKYILSDEGRDALRTVETVEKTTKPEPSNRKTHPTSRSKLWKVASVGLVLVLFISLIFIASQKITLDTQISELKSTSEKEEIQITRLNMSLGAAIAASIQMDNAMGYAQAVLGTTKPQPQNLTYISDGKTTKIEMLSTDIGYCYYPNPWFINSTHGQNQEFHLRNNKTIVGPGYVYSHVLENYSWVIGTKSDPTGYLLIGATIRNNYTPADATNRTDAPVGTYGGKYGSNMVLTVKLFRADGTEVQTEALNYSAITQYSIIQGDWSYYIGNIGNGRFSQECGKTIQVVFYIAPENLDFDHYEIYVSSLKSSLQMPILG